MDAGHRDEPAHRDEPGDRDDPGLRATTEPAPEAPLESWIGRTQEETDRVGPTPVRALAATLDDASIDTADGAPLPELWSWLYFLPIVPMSQVGPDGHPKRGGFLPPIALERRMWASGRLTFHDRLRIGDAVTKRAEIVKIAEKTGKAGRMVFVTVRHEVFSPRGLAVREEQDIVYIAMPDKFVPPAPTPLPENLAWREPVRIDPVLLFRFSALTFNGHRIHYDEPYAMGVEKYPGLVVHGPLQAILLMQSARRHAPGRLPARYEFRAVRPLFGFDAVSVAGRLREDGGHDLFTANGDGAIGMQATIGWA
ncbi:hypothetical protein A33M_1370 [Rhodovulum sp. PH10]|uniref:FAS1-like dehydratase domain-containing protein n=1 Tax=Rhodovulum sp. PH10 TaxID=1187851 RepID=UPI00027C2415|nr:MaoC family dehydratase N-terminal domain-containing protein [Rhodovulum sp. PH10]EJW09416.1 hypothetical protein A33M_1370 [Rhodovulum sp. PH10]